MFLDYHFMYRWFDAFPWYISVINSSHTKNPSVVLFLKCSMAKLFHPINSHCDENMEKRWILSNQKFISFIMGPIFFTTFL